MTRHIGVSISVIVIITALLPSCKPSDQPRATHPAPTITPQTSPDQVAHAFIRALEQFLEYEHSQPQKADAAISFASQLVADTCVTTAVSSSTKLKSQQLSPQAVSQIKQSFASSWAAVINFYRTHIEYPEITASPPAGTTQSTTVSVMLPADRPGPTQPVHIVVVCTREDTWKVKFVGMAPASKGQFH